MKAIILMLLLAFSVSLGYAQEEIKGRAKEMGFQNAITKEWTVFKRDDSYIVFNEETVVIYGISTTHTFTKISDVIQEEDVISGVIHFGFHAVDAKGKRCDVRVVTGGISSISKLYIDYSDFTICYRYDFM